MTFIINKKKKMCKKNKNMEATLIEESQTTISFFYAFIIESSYVWHKDFLMRCRSQ